MFRSENVQKHGFGFWLRRCNTGLCARAPEYRGSNCAARIRGRLSNRRGDPEEAQATVLNILSIDVEEYFHPTEVGLEMSRWTSMVSLVESQTSAVLDMMERHNARATFFILGWVAERNPALVRKIAAAGHEIGCHSYAHRLVYDLSPDEFRKDTMRAVSVIADACGIRPKIYRAPSYSVTLRSLWALDVLAECGFTHDSSIYPIVHDRYGIPSFGRNAQIVQTASGPICEVPIATVRLSKSTVAPVGGGGYLRLLPYRYTAAGIRRLNLVDQQAACIYLHPWELDPNQPRLTHGLIGTMRTYMGLNGMRSKLDRLLRDFQFASLTEVHPGTPGKNSESSDPQLRLAAGI